MPVNMMRDVSARSRLRSMAAASFAATCAIFCALQCCAGEEDPGLSGPGPVGTLIVRFSCPGMGDGKIYLIDTRTGETQGHLEHWDHAVTLTEDGTVMVQAFENEFGTRFDAYRVYEGGRIEVRSTIWIVGEFYSFDETTRWTIAPDGSALVVDRHLFDFDTGETVDLFAQLPAGIDPSVDGEARPIWSPDSRHLMVFGQSAGAFVAFYDRGEYLWGLALVEKASFSPGGEWIAFEQAGSFGDVDVAVLDPSSTAVRMQFYHVPSDTFVARAPGPSGDGSRGFPILSSDPDGRGPFWLPDGNTILGFCYEGPPEGEVIEGYDPLLDGLMCAVDVPATAMAGQIEARWLPVRSEQGLPTPAIYGAAPDGRSVVIAWRDIGTVPGADGCTYLRMVEAQRLQLDGSGWTPIATIGPFCPWCLDGDDCISMGGGPGVPGLAGISALTGELIFDTFAVDESSHEYVPLAGETQNGYAPDWSLYPLSPDLLSRLNFHPHSRVHLDSPYRLAYGGYPEDSAVKAIDVSLPPFDWDGVVCISFLSWR